MQGTHALRVHLSGFTYIAELIDNDMNESARKLQKCILK